MDHTRVLIRAKFETSGADDQRLFHFGEQYAAADGRFGRGRQQSVIAATVHATQRRAGKAANAIGFEPFPSGGLRKIAAHLSAEPKKTVAIRAGRLRNRP